MKPEINPNHPPAAGLPRLRLSRLQQLRLLGYSALAASYISLSLYAATGDPTPFLRQIITRLKRPPKS